MENIHIFKKEDWKLIIDAGQPGPSYIPGHAHCDALSFELYYKGKPAAVNCGTYAYQSEKRKFFRGTSAHNTLMINGREQSLCWGFFRMAGRSKVRVLSVNEKHLKARIRDYSGRIAIRRFDIGNDLVVTDTAKGSELTAWFHPLINLESSYTCEHVHEEKQPYAPEYGICREISAVSYKGRNRLKLRIRLE